MVSMELKTWRLAKGLTLDQAGQMLGLSGVNVARAFQRIETGESPADADMAAAIGELTGGAVGADDLNAVRLAWLRENDRAREFNVEPAR
jgi:transcriptional regulator with XRE-family HTH domain